MNDTMWEDNWVSMLDQLVKKTPGIMYIWSVPWIQQINNNYGTILMIKTPTWMFTALDKFGRFDFDQLLISLVCCFANVFCDDLLITVIPTKVRKLIVYQ